MAVPEEIRRVERPRNTVVVDRGGNGPRRFAVVKRVGCRRVGTRNVPVNGPTVGHIIAGRYVPKPTVEPGTGQAPPRVPVASREADVLSWAAYKVVAEAGDGLLDELLAVFDPVDALNIYAIACLRVAKPGVCDGRLKGAYERSWLRVSLPGAQLSKNKVSQLVEGVGRARSLVAEFMRRRAARVAEDHHVLVDGTLVQDNSRVNDLSKFSRKARVKGTRDISVLYALDLETGEPVCGKAYPGNVVDSVSYADFLTECGLRAGIIVGDKAFAHRAAEGVFGERPELHWLNPLKRNDKRIAENGMFEWEGILEGLDRDVKYRKADLGDGGFLYAFYDRRRAAKEERDWFRRQKGKEGKFDAEKARESDERFGTVVFESDLDMDPLTVWKSYEERWQIELVFDYYKQALDLDDTRVQSEDSVVGSEFVNFIAVTITTRVIKRFEEAGLLDKYSYGAIMEDLRTLEIVRVEEDGEWVFSRTTKRARELADRLGLEAPTAA